MVEGVWGGGGGGGCCPTVYWRCERREVKLDGATWSGKTDASENSHASLPPPVVPGSSGSSSGSSATSAARGQTGLLLN